MRYLIPIIVLLSLAACDYEPPAPAPKPRVKPDFTYLRCSDRGADVVLLQLGKIGEDFVVDVGGDAEYYSKSYYFKDGLNNLAGRELPTTKVEYDSEMSSIDLLARDQKGAGGRMSVYETSIDIPTTARKFDTFRLDRETLSFSAKQYNPYLRRYTIEADYKCEKINRKQLRDELESMRVKLETYKMRMQAVNPVDTRKI